MSEDMNENEDIENNTEPDSDAGPDTDDELVDEELGSEFEDAEPTSEEGVEDDAEDDEEETTRPRARAVEDDDDDEEEEDVEADLNEILQGRLAADEDDEEEEAPIAAADKPGAVNTRKSDEFVCGICFMVVAQKQSALSCPMGDGLEPHQPLDM